MPDAFISQPPRASDRRVAACLCELAPLDHGIRTDIAASWNRGRSDPRGHTPVQAMVTITICATTYIQVIYIYIYISPTGECRAHKTDECSVLHIAI